MVAATCDPPLLSSRTTADSHLGVPAPMGTTCGSMSEADGVTVPSRRHAATRTMRFTAARTDNPGAMSGCKGMFSTKTRSSRMVPLIARPRQFDDPERGHAQRRGIARLEYERDADEEQPREPEVVGVASCHGGLDHALQVGSAHEGDETSDEQRHAGAHWENVQGLGSVSTADGAPSWQRIGCRGHLPPPRKSLASPLPEQAGRQPELQGGGLAPVDPDRLAALGRIARSGTGAGPPA